MIRALNSHIKIHLFKLLFFDFFSSPKTGTTKFNTILSSLAITALQVHAIPTAADSAAINARSPNTLEERGGYCCLRFRDSIHNVASFIPRGNGEDHWSLPGRCYMIVKRNANSCNGWTFIPSVTCDELAHPASES
ncbi:hypothetical protein E4U31_000757 [Claviceps sp. LM219 group G6]|nr:hypothetical protein E4U31_000757 [Claviceps sp. LM219 group G6]KAG6119160.1 hypothetical protein E4U14_005829 [Claviceps sp. LM454 group G7]